MKRYLRSAILASGSAVAIIAAAPLAAGPTIVYEDLPTNVAAPPTGESHHNASGPVIADDFIPTMSVAIGHITWWGNWSDSTNFEVVLQNNDPVLNQPALTPAGNIATGGLKQFVTAVVNPYSIPGIFQYDADIAPGWNIAAGQDYWLTVANFAAGWQWAQALGGPTVGSELYNAHRSVGPLCDDGGPHCGPWTDVHTDFAFRIAAVPEPASWALMLSGFAMAGMALRRQRAVQVRFS